MADPKLFSEHQWYKAFFTNKGDGINVGIGYINYGKIPPPPLNYMKNSYLFDKSVIELVAL